MSNLGKRMVPVFVAMILIGMFGVNARGQNGMSNARSVAMSGAYTAIARGVEAPGWNPANLGLSGKHKYRLNLFSVGVGLDNNSFTKKHYDLYNGKYLTEQDKQDILNIIPADGLLFDLDSEVQALGFSIGSYAFTASGMASSGISLSRDVVDLLLNGNEFGRLYEIGDSGGEGYGYSSFALSGGIPIALPMLHEFSVGVTVKYLKGFAYGVIREATTTFSTDIDGLHGNGRLVIERAMGGNGFGLDLGVAGKLDKNLTISLSVSNIINNMKWNRETERSTYTFQADSVSVQKIDKSDIDSVLVSSDETINIEPFSTQLPAILRLGVAHTGKRLTLGFNITQGLKRGTGASTKPRFALGSEFRLIGFLPLRAGIAFGGDDGPSSSVGFAIDFSFFSWDFALASRGKILGGKGLGFAFNWMFRI